MQIGLLKAIRYFGTQRALAEALGVKQQSISHWLNRENSIPYTQVLKIVCVTQGSVTFEELAPDHPLNENLHRLLTLYHQANGHDDAFSNRVSHHVIDTKFPRAKSKHKENEIKSFQRKQIFLNIINRLHLKDYSRISTQYWVEVVNPDMKRLGADPILISFYLCTCPHANRIGIYPLPHAYMAYDTGLSEERVKKALEDLQQLNYCSYDQEREYVWVHDMATHQIAAQLSRNDERARLMNVLYHALPELSFLDDFFEFYKDRFFLTPRRSDAFEGILDHLEEVCLSTIDPDYF